jgi:acyl-CoA synthetase (AMP-forming)/AMP-acid ligase II
VGLSSFWKLIEKYECTWTSVVPSILSILLRWPDVKSKRRTLKGILCGGQVLTKQIQTDFGQTFEVPIFEGFGLTETTSFACFNNFPASKRRVGSIGKPFSINEMKILNEEGVELEAMQEGEICIRGLNVAEEYLNFAHKNAESFRSGWFHSGDYGFCDEDGYFYFVGRKDFLIIKGGENIYPSELEDVLFGHEDVVDCAVIGIPDTLLGEDLCAFVKLKEDSTLKPEELKNFCIGRIAQFKQPKKIIVINNLENLNEIPKGPTQKVLYRKLKNFVTHI